jgi:hypothetical protein
VGAKPKKNECKEKRGGDCISTGLIRQILWAWGKGLSHDWACCRRLGTSQCFKSLEECSSAEKSKTWAYQEAICTVKGHINVGCPCCFEQHPCTAHSKSKSPPATSKIKSTPKNKLYRKKQNIWTLRLLRIPHKTDYFRKHTDAYWGVCSHLHDEQLGLTCLQKKHR